MNKQELVSAVSDVVADTSVSSTTILGLLNRCVLELAGGGSRNWGQPLCGPLPDLLSSGTVATDTNHNVSMPATFHRNLFRVTDSSGNNIKIYDSFPSMVDRYQGLTQTGAVEAVCLRGNTLYYQGVPAAAQTLTLWFYRLPVDMSTDASTPDGIPTWLHYRLLVNYACMHIWARKEDGIEGAKVNTSYHESEYQAALTDLHRFIGTLDKDPVYIEDSSDYITEDFYGE